MVIMMMMLLMMMPFCSQVAQSSAEILHANKKLLLNKVRVGKNRVLHPKPKSSLQAVKVEKSGANEEHPDPMPDAKHEVWRDQVSGIHRFAQSLVL